MLLAPLGAEAQIAKNVNFRGQLGYGPELSDIWGWTDPANGNEYALVTLTNGVSIVDVTDPTSPTELFNIPGASTIWRDVKTWGDYAYVISEANDDLLIIDMSNLPASINTFNWDGGIGYSSSHNIFIDENGIAYLCGSNSGLGTLFLDVDANPTNPPVLGSYTTRYVHDLYVENDIMYTAEINNGIFSVVDVTNKAAPNVLATESTSSNFTHNIWLSADGNYVFTTDEVSGANVDAYDISDLSDISRVDEFRPPTGPSSIPHNTFVRGDFLVTAWYRDGMRITDASRPDNMIEVGFYDSSPLSGNGFNGAWGVYPYLASGNALIADIEEGLFVVTPSYTGAAFLDGLVTDASSGIPLFGATITITGTGVSATTGLTGQYSTGLADGGSYDVTVTRTGYAPANFTGVSLTAGTTQILNAALNPLTAYTQTGQVVDAGTGAGVPGASVEVTNGSDVFTATTDASGNFSLGGFFPGTYDVIGGKWGYVTDLQSGVTLNSGTGPVVISVNAGFYDDFALDFGWTVNSTASTGQWVRDVPIGTSSGTIPGNVDFDLGTDIGDQCFMTGNGGGGWGTDDVDAGRTVLTSPVFDLSGSGDPDISYSTWFINDGGSGAPNDSLIIKITDGISTATVQLILDGDAAEGGFWASNTFRVQDFVTLTANMQLIVETSDLAAAGGHIVEAGLDLFQVIGAAPPVGCPAPSNPTISGLTSTSVTVSWTGPADATQWQIQGRPVGAANFKKVASPTSSRFIDILNPGVTYEWKVRAQCTSGEISDFSTLETFTTPVPKSGEFDLAVGPVPASQNAFIEIAVPASSSNTLMEIYDLEGQLVYSRNLPEGESNTRIQIDVSQFAAGTYVVRASSGEEVLTQKLVVQ